MKMTAIQASISYWFLIFPEAIFTYLYSIQIYTATQICKIYTDLYRSKQIYTDPFWPPWNETKSQDTGHQNAVKLLGCGMSDHHFKTLEHFGTGFTCLAHFTRLHQTSPTLAVAFAPTTSPAKARCRRSVDGPLHSPAPVWGLLISLDISWLHAKAMDLFLAARHVSSCLFMSSFSSYLLLASCLSCRNTKLGSPLILSQFQSKQALVVSASVS